MLKIISFFNNKIDWNWFLCHFASQLQEQRKWSFHTNRSWRRNQSRLFAIAVHQTGRLVHRVLRLQLWRDEYCGWPDLRRRTDRIEMQNGHKSKISISVQCQWEIRRFRLHQLLLNDPMWFHESFRIRPTQFTKRNWNQFRQGAGHIFIYLTNLFNWISLHRASL